MGYEPGFLKVLGNDISPKGIPRKKHIAAHIALTATNVVMLSFSIKNIF
jgi:hypothetical protein